MLFFSFFENCRIFALLLSFFLSFAVSFQTIKREKSLCEQEGGGGMTFKYSSKKKIVTKLIIVRVVRSHMFVLLLTQLCFQSVFFGSFPFNFSFLIANKSSLLFAKHLNTLLARSIFAGHKCQGGKNWMSLKKVDFCILIKSTILKLDSSCQMYQKIQLRMINTYKSTY